MSDIDPNKLKVAELREELKSRGLETKGTKAVLVKRLQQALNKEKGIADGDESFVDLDASQEEEHLDESSQDGVQLDDSSQDVTEDAVAEKEPKEYDVGGGDTEGEDADPEQIEGDEYLEGGPEGEEFQTIDETSQDEEGTEDARDDRKEDKGQKRKRSRSRDRRRSRSRDRSRRSRSRSRDRRRSPFKKVEMEDDSWAQSTEYWLDRYNCDLTLRVDDSGYKGHPLSAEGFGFMWSGVRATYGVNKGKVAFEVKILEELSVDHLPEEEVNRHVVRVGWSTDDTSLQLGEEEFSYGYGGTGKASTEINFKDYGEKFGSGDVITAYLDYDSETPTISFSKNGEDLGTCFEIERSTLDGVSLFPHVLTKNTEFECNFGQNAEPWFALKEEFDFAGKIPLEERQRASTPPEKKEECEIIMVVGLPGAGKTVWAGKHAAENPEKKYNILGTNNIIDKMKVMGLPRKRNYAGRWDVLIDKSTKCLNRMIEIAARKKRNYILDQTNVYASARRRKMTPFEGFQRKAVVVIPTDEEFKSRIAQREKEEGKDVPEKAVLEMKANFVLPEDGQLFDSVEFIEMKREEAEKLVDKYRKEAQALLPPPEKRFRGDRFGSRGRFDRRDFRSGRGGYDRERFGGRGGSRGGYRDSRRPPPRHYDRRGGYGGGYGGGNRGGGYFPRGSRSPSNRYNDRNKNFWDKRSSSNYRQPVPRQSFTNQRSGGGSGYGSGQWNRHGNYYGSNNQGSSWGHQGNWNHGHWGSGSSSSPPGYGNWNYGHSGHQGGQGYGGSQWGQNWNQNYWPSYSQNQNYSQCSTQDSYMSGENN